MLRLSAAPTRSVRVVQHLLKEPLETGDVTLVTDGVDFWIRVWIGHGSHATDDRTNVVWYKVTTHL